MEVPQEAVNALSDTQWGAILLLMAAMMGSAITYLAFYVRSLNRTILEISEKRTQDAKDFGKQAQGLEREALQATGAATAAVKDLQRSSEDVEKEVKEFRDETRRNFNRLMDRREP